MTSLSQHPVLDYGDRLASNKETVRDGTSFKPSEMRRWESEGLIPVSEEYILIYVVDCPSLHLVDGSALLLPAYLRNRNSDLITFDDIQTCSQCAGAFTKARRIPEQPKGQIERGEFTQRILTPLSISSGSLSPPLAVSSQTSLVGQSVAAVPPQQLPLYTTQPPNHPPLPSERFPAHEEPLDWERGSLLNVDRPLPNQNTRRPTAPSISSVSADSNSFRENTRTSQPSTNLFGWQWKRSSKPAKKSSVKPDAASSLPDSIQFCFSNCARYLLVWRRNGDSVVRICAHENNSKLLSLTNSIPHGEVDRSVNIRLVAEGEGWISVILLNKQRFSLVILNSVGSQQISKYLPNGVRPICLAMSRNNSFIAVGYGSFVQIFCFQQNQFVWTTELHIKEFRPAEEVRFQVMTFSPDCKFLTVATQKYDKLKGKEDDGVWTRVWMVKEIATEGTLYGFCFMPTDHLGVTSAFYDPQLKKVFVTGFIDTPYPLFHCASQDSLQQWSLREIESFSPELLPTSASRPVSFKVRCASQSPHPSYACFLTATNKLYRVNVKTETTELLCDVSAQRGRLGPREETAALGMTIQGIIYMVWKEGAKIHFIEIDHSGTQTKRMDLRRLYEEAFYG